MNSKATKEIFIKWIQKQKTYVQHVKKVCSPAYAFIILIHKQIITKFILYFIQCTVISQQYNYQYTFHNILIVIYMNHLHKSREGTNFFDMLYMQGT